MCNEEKPNKEQMRLRIKNSAIGNYLSCKKTHGNINYFLKLKCFPDILETGVFKGTDIISKLSKCGTLYKEILKILETRGVNRSDKSFNLQITSADPFVDIRDMMILRTLFQYLTKWNVSIDSKPRNTDLNYTICLTSKKGIFEYSLEDVVEITDPRKTIFTYEGGSFYMVREDLQRCVEKNKDFTGFAVKDISKKNISDTYGIIYPLDY